MSKKKSNKTAPKQIKMDRDEQIVVNGPIVNPTKIAEKTAPGCGYCNFIKQNYPDLTDDAVKNNCPTCNPNEKVAPVETAAQRSTRYDAELKQNIENMNKLKLAAGLPLTETGTTTRQTVAVQNDAGANVVISAGKKDGKRYDFEGHPVTAVLRWMGKSAWKFEDARNVLNKLGLNEVADGTLKAQLGAGKNGLRGPAASLTETQVAKLETLAGKAQPPKDEVEPVKAKKSKKASK